MKKFNKVIFWCEFPEKIDFEKLNNFFKENDFKAKIGIACTSIDDYNRKRMQINKLSNIETVMAWPTLPKERGYWFSSQTSKKDIDKLDQYKGVNFKLDIEPPLPKTKFLTLWFFKQLFIKGKNKEYLEKKINELKPHSKIMLSTFPLPRFILRRIGVVFSSDLSYNYIFYTTLIPKPLRPLFRLLWIPFIKRRLKEDPQTYFAVGAITEGIFGNEPTFSSPKKLEKDLKFLLDRGVRNCVVFRSGSFQEKENPKSWLDAIKQCYY